MTQHIRDRYQLICHHEVVCGCNHDVGDLVWCYECQDYIEVKSITIEELK